MPNNACRRAAGIRRGPVGCHIRPGPGVGTASAVHIKVDDVQQAYDELVAAGHKPAGEPAKRIGGGMEFELADPDGYRLASSSRSRRDPGGRQTPGTRHPRQPRSGIGGF